ncbi:hypothetical protein BDV25DRAFT_126220 [Aspergillus avenaceus]|uniref:Zn(2)-C6 fungal-type domain-containing protein n=1 Tax=Aspergillus avenaceus TaxID=36643 RepID=A0A5N6U8W9_ASPAV|nr:hypothetical protein BDV25DRAFT_126220 [Aspergillus avenaceus]
MSTLNPRSCRRCNQKKIRCIKTTPCSNCTKVEETCVFPAPGRIPRRRKRPLKAELVNRLSRLEQELNALGGGPSSHAESEESELLIQGRGQSQYVNHKALGSLVDQIKHLQGMVESEEERSEDNDFASEINTQSSNDTSFVYGYSSAAQSLCELYPNVADSLFLWQIYEERVAPVVMIPHRPTTATMIHKACNGPDPPDRASEAIMFAVYFAAVTSLKPSECELRLGEDRCSALQRHRFAAQQALARAEFLQTRDPLVLQAAVLFLTCLRHASTRSRTSYDTRLPLNINDTDISPDGSSMPEERRSFTTTTFCIARCEKIASYRCISKSASTRQDQSSAAHLRDLEQLHNRLQSQYLRLCDVSIPIQWITATIIRLAMSRVWLIANIPRLSSGEICSGSPEHERLFQTAIEVVEFAYLLEIDERTARWSWLFEAYPQWHAIAFVLAEVCTRSKSPETYRAWTVAEQAYLRWRSRDSQGKGTLLKAISQIAPLQGGLDMGTVRNVPVPQNTECGPSSSDLLNDVLSQRI